MARTEYYDDPDAPEPNSLVVAASAVVVDEQGRLLLQRRRDNDLWALPGGAMEMTESLPARPCGRSRRNGPGRRDHGSRRHVHRPRHVIAYGDGEVRRQFNVCFTARIVGGTLAISEESTELRFVAPGELAALPMHHTQRLRVGHALERRSAPYLG